MDYACGKFDNCSFNRFGFIVRTDRHAHTDADERLTPATVVDVSNKLHKLSLFRSITVLCIASEVNMESQVIISVI